MDGLSIGIIKFLELILELLSPRFYRIESVTLSGLHRFLQLPLLRIKSLTYIKTSSLLHVSVLIVFGTNT